MDAIHSAFWMLWDVKIEILIGSAVLFLIDRLLKRNRPKIPGPYPWPIIGNAISLGPKPQYAMQAMAKR